MDDLERAVSVVAAEVPWLVDVHAATLHVRARVGDRSPTPSQLRELCLAQACEAGDSDALDTLLGLVREVATRIRWPAVEVGDRCARIWTHLLDVDAGGRTRLMSFDGRGPLGAWLRVVATRLAQRDRFGAEREPEPMGEDHLAAIWASAAAGTEHDLIKDMYVDGVRDAFRRATASLDETARSLLSLHYARGVSLEKLTRVYGVHRVTLSRRLAAAHREILERVVAELTRDAAMTEGECRSLLRTLRSRLELSLGPLH
jgi:RNA polymerase sigma-70 factor (ECF subfamily)